MCISSRLLGWDGWSCWSSCGPKPSSLRVRCRRSFFHFFFKEPGFPVNSRSTLGNDRLHPVKLSSVTLLVLFSKGTGTGGMINLNIRKFRKVYGNLWIELNSIHAPWACISNAPYQKFLILAVSTELERNIRSSLHTPTEEKKKRKGKCLRDSTRDQLPLTLCSHIRSIASRLN